MFPLAPLQFHLFVYYCFSTCFQGQSTYFLWVTNYHSYSLDQFGTINYLLIFSSRPDWISYSSLTHSLIFKTFDFLHIYFKIGTYYFVFCSCFLNSFSETFLISFVICSSSQTLSAIFLNLFENILKYDRWSRIWTLQISRHEIESAVESINSAVL